MWRSTQAGPEGIPQAKAAGSSDVGGGWEGGSHLAQSGGQAVRALALAHESIGSGSESQLPRLGAAAQDDNRQIGNERAEDGNHVDGTCAGEVPIEENEVDTARLDTGHEFLGGGRLSYHRHLRLLLNRQTQGRTDLGPSIG